MQPQSPNPNYDFIMQNGPPPKPGLKLSGMSMPKMVLMGIGGLFVLAVLIIGYSIIAGASKVNGQAYINVVARSQEIMRVSTEAAQLATDSQTQNLASTAQISLSSSQAQLTAYLAGQKIVVTQLQLNADKSTTTDSQLQAAATSGNLDSVYVSYMKSDLTKYSTDLKAAYNGAGANGKKILNNAYNSAQVLLETPQIAKAN